MFNKHNNTYYNKNNILFQIFIITYHLSVFIFIHLTFSISDIQLIKLVSESPILSAFTCCCSHTVVNFTFFP